MAGQETQARTKPETNDKPGEAFFKSWELRLAVIGTVLTLIGLLITAVVSVISQRESAVQMKREASKPFYEKQLGLYVQASEAVATMATVPSDRKEWQDAYFTFLRLYTGPLYLVESTAVRKQMVDIRMFLIQCHVNDSIYLKQPVLLTSANRATLERKSQDLAEMMFAGTNEWWEFKRAAPSSGSASSATK